MASPEKKKPRLDRGFRLDGGKTAGIVKALQIALPSLMRKCLSS